MKIIPKQGVVTNTTPANTILTLAEMKSICYVDTVMTDDDTMLTNMEVAARNLCEKFLGRPLLTATQSLYYSCSQLYSLYNDAVLELPGGKLQSIDSIKVYDTSNDATTIETDTYETSVTGEEAQVYFTGFPSINDPRELDYMEIAITSGFGDTTTDVPQEIKQGMLFLIAYWYEHREDQKMGSITSSAKAMWSPWKLQRNG